MAVQPPPYISDPARNPGKRPPGSGAATAGRPGGRPMGSPPPAPTAQTGANRPYVHALGENQTWKQLADMYGISVDRLKALNPDVMRLRGQDAGTFINLRRSPMRVNLGGGETWKEVADRFGMTVEELRALNPDIGRLRDVEAGTKLRLQERPDPLSFLDPWDAIQFGNDRLVANQGLAQTLADIDYQRGLENLRFTQTRDNVLTSFNRNMEDLMRNRGIDMTRLIDSLNARGLTGSGVANRFRNQATGAYDVASGRLTEDFNTANTNNLNTQLLQLGNLDNSAILAEQQNAETLAQIELAQATAAQQAAAASVVGPGGAGAVGGGTAPAANAGGGGRPGAGGGGVVGQTLPDQMGRPPRKPPKGPNTGPW